jgi:hypothetical protein
MGKRKKRQSANSNKAQLKHEVQAQSAFKHLKIIEAEDAEKMSAVILKFVAPYQHLIHSKKAYEHLIVLAMVAWNATILEGETRQRLMDRVKETILSDGDEDWSQELADLLAQLMQRKERYFADNKRLILDYRVSESRQEYHLAVISTP